MRHAMVKTFIAARYTASPGALCNPTPTDDTTKLRRCVRKTTGAILWRAAPLAHSLRATLPRQAHSETSLSLLLATCAEAFEPHLPRIRQCTIKYNVRSVLYVCNGFEANGGGRHMTLLSAIANHAPLLLICTFFFALRFPP